MSEHDRPLAATPSQVTRRITTEQLNGLRDARDNLAECLRVARRNLEELDDHMAMVSGQVVTESDE